MRTKGRLWIIIVLLTCCLGTGRVQTVRNGSNAKIGCIESNGTVRNGSNRMIGSAEGIRPAYAAVFFFFRLFNN